MFFRFLNQIEIIVLRRYSRYDESIFHLQSGRLMTTLIVCLFIAVLLPYLLKMVVVSFMQKEGKYDNHYPRAQQARLQGMGARAVAAHQNSFESLLIFATAVLAAIATNHVSLAVQVLAFVYIVSRVIYSYFYIMDMASLRSAIWFVGFFCCLAILWLCMI